ncbi:hypothetical protein PCANC_15239 [Puccinia coronata f. sp. avenae]|uniref:Uncharacterized protein n=1 Tax=Puccinia coronata f. sp. avenae TaxID=200324 RepID=A0A2N5RUJ9_9BASI|nr:hypothetical protein PCANC_28452 [Puccinia coronata f. sp. avenae]PLW34588.1 hypothetical protein PCASD_19237 [Puccinia coronata f. sp. avenae]PLW51585.1 hypothetical protein PCANC_15239 [Puccinia coronata f. sp. avenae]
MVPNTNAKTHWPEGEHDPSDYNKDHESGSGNDHELVTSRSQSSNGVRNPLDDRYRPFIKKNQSSRGARLLLMNGLHQPSRGGVLLLMAGPSRSSRGERTPVDNPGRPVIKRRMPPLDDQTALAIKRRRPPLDGQSVPVIERKEYALLLMTSLYRSSGGGFLLLITRLSRSSRGVRAPPGNLDKPVVKRSTCPLGWYQLGKQVGRLAGLVPARQAGRPAL